MTEEGAYQQGQSIVAAVAFSSTRDPKHQTVTLTAAGGQLEITEVMGELLDPNTVALLMRNGNGVATRSTYGLLAQTYTIVKDATGVYYAEILLDVPGRWLYRWEGDAGTSQAKVSWEAEIAVRPIRVSVP